MENIERQNALFVSGRRGAGARARRPIDITPPWQPALELRPDADKLDESMRISFIVLGCLLTLVQMKEPL